MTQQVKADEYQKLRDKLKTVDDEILRYLHRDGKGTAPFIAEEIDYARSYVVQRLDTLDAYDVVESLHHGHWRITEHGSEYITGEIDELQQQPDDDEEDEEDEDDVLTDEELRELERETRSSDRIDEGG